MTAAQAACQFVRHMVDRNYEAASAMAHPDAAPALAPDALRQQFEAMMHGTRLMGYQMVMEMDQWPDKAADDIGWVYVAIEGDVYSEAVTAVVCLHDGAPHIRQVEWGRP